MQYLLLSGEDHVDGGRGGESEMRGKGHSRTVSDVSYISTGSGSQGVGTCNSAHTHTNNNALTLLTISLFLFQLLQQFIGLMPVSFVNTHTQHKTSAVIVLYMHVQYNNDPFPPYSSVETGTGEWHLSGASRGDAGPPTRILFVEEITGLIAESLPEFWKLGQAYVSGSLFQGMHMVDERQRLQQENCDKNRDRFEVGGRSKYVCFSNIFCFVE